MVVLAISLMPVFFYFGSYRLRYLKVVWQNEILLYKSSNIFYIKISFHGERATNKEPANKESRSNGFRFEGEAKMYEPYAAARYKVIQLKRWRRVCLLGTGMRGWVFGRAVHRAAGPLLSRYGQLCAPISKRKYRASRTVNVFLAEISCNLPAR